VGIDPLVNVLAPDVPDDIVKVPGYFSAETYHAALGAEKARAITSIAMFYDLDSPHEFVSVVQEALAPDGVWVLEQSYLPTMLNMNAFDTICHEHLEYYAYNPLVRLFRDHGLRVFDVSLNDVNGGSFRLYVCHEGGPYRPNQKALDDLMSQEAEMELSSSKPYTEFRKRIEKLRAEFNRFVTAERKRGKRFFVYGASTKGNTLLQYYGLDNTTIEAAADKNSGKWGRRTPATGIPIVSEEEARKSKPDYFLVLPWHFKPEFVEREAEFRRDGGKLVFPLPALEIV